MIFQWVSKWFKPLEQLTCTTVIKTNSLLFTDGFQVGRRREGWSEREVGFDDKFIEGCKVD